MAIERQKESLRRSKQYQQVYKNGHLILQEVSRKSKDSSGSRSPLLHKPSNSMLEKKPMSLGPTPHIKEVNFEALEGKEYIKMVNPLSIRESPKRA